MGLGLNVRIFLCQFVSWDRDQGNLVIFAQVSQCLHCFPEQFDVLGFRSALIAAQLSKRILICLLVVAALLLRCKSICITTIEPLAIERSFCLFGCLFFLSAFLLELLHCRILKLVVNSEYRSILAVIIPRSFGVTQSEQYSLRTWLFALAGHLVSEGNISNSAPLVPCSLGPNYS